MNTLRTVFKSRAAKLVGEAYISAGIFVSGVSWCNYSEPLDMLAKSEMYPDDKYLSNAFVRRLSLVIGCTFAGILWPLTIKTQAMLSRLTFEERIDWSITRKETVRLYESDE
jgi:hypothetical protein